MRSARSRSRRPNSRRNSNVGRSWVCDASPLIALAKIDRIDLLSTLPDELVIVDAVAEEVRQAGEDDPARRWLDAAGAEYVKARGEIVPTIAAWDLGRGESAVLSWVIMHPGSEAIVDDRAARNCAAAIGVPVRGTIGVMLLAKREGRIEHVRPILEDLARVGLHLDSAIVEATLRLAQE